MSEPRSTKATKRVLCDTLEALFTDEGPPPDEKKRLVLPYVYRHAVALAEERSRGLPSAAHDELVSSVGERAAIVVQRLDTTVPPAQQATFIDGQLHHALADAGRAADPLGRGPRTLRRRFEAACEARAQSNGALPALAEREDVLDEIVGPEKPALRLLVGHGVTPDEAVAHVSGRCEQEASDPGEAVVVAAARHQIAKAIAAHPDRGVREYLFKVAAGLTARRPADFQARLGPTIPALIGAWFLEENCG